MHRIGQLLVAAAIGTLAGCSAPAGDRVDGVAPVAAETAAEAAAPAERLVTDAPGTGYVAARAEASPSRGATPGHGSVALPDGRAPVSTVAASESGQTPGEVAFLPDGTIDAGQLAAQMRGEHWDQTVARFIADAAMDPDASQLQVLYEQALRESLEQHGLVLVQFGCGLTLCAGTARGPLRDDDYPDQHGYLDLGEGLRNPVRVVRLLETAQYMELRFSFSTENHPRNIRLGR